MDNYNVEDFSIKIKNSSFDIIFLEVHMNQVFTDRSKTKQQTFLRHPSKRGMRKQPWIWENDIEIENKWNYVVRGQHGDWNESNSEDRIIEMGSRAV